jgi:hypothetical protein
MKIKQAMTDWLPFEFIPGYRRPDHPWRHEFIEIRNWAGNISVWRYADIPPGLNIAGCFWRAHVRAEDDIDQNETDDPTPVGSSETDFKAGLSVICEKPSVLQGGL